jgi:glycosyltransferase involved in cell wall biosynthesis
MSILLLLFLNVFLNLFSELNAEQNKFVFVISSYNNANWCHKNLESVLFQDYPKQLFRIIYTDDCSIDGTNTLVTNFINKNNAQDQITLIKNRTRIGALANYYNMLQLCADDEVAVMTDGDDWLKNHNVLSILDEIYQNPNVWLTYGKYDLVTATSQVPDLGQAFPNEVVANGNYLEFFKNNQFRATPLRSFRAWLFKSIDKSLLINHAGEFFKTASDVAYMLGMLNIAKDKIYFINQSLYMYNTIRPDNDYKVNGNTKQQEIREIFAKYD